MRCQNVEKLALNPWFLILKLLSAERLNFEVDQLIHCTKMFVVASILLLTGFNSLFPFDSLGPFDSLAANLLAGMVAAAAAAAAAAAFVVVVIVVVVVVVC